MRVKLLSGWALLKAYWYRLRHDFSRASLKHLHNRIFDCLLLGLDTSALEQHVDDFVTNLLDKLNFSVFQELRFAQHLGAYTVIMSGSPNFLVSRIADLLGVDEWVGTEYVLDATKKLSGIKTFIDGDAKAKALKVIVERQKASLDQVVVYSDSHHDLPLFDLAGEAVVVNPDPVLQALSAENKWRVL